MLGACRKEAERRATREGVRSEKMFKERRPSIGPFLLLSRRPLLGARSRERSACGFLLHIRSRLPRRSKGLRARSEPTDTLGEGSGRDSGLGHDIISRIPGLVPLVAKARRGENTTSTVQTGRSRTRPQRSSLPHKKPAPLSTLPQTTTHPAIEIEGPSLGNSHPSSSRSLRASSLSCRASGPAGGTSRVIWNCSRAASVFPITM